MQDETGMPEDEQSFMALVGGCVGVPVLWIVVFILTLVGWGLLKLVFKVDPVEWWHHWFGEPIYRLVVRALLIAQGDLLLALGIVALGKWALSNLIGVPGQAAIRPTIRYQATVTPGMMTLEEARSRLRDMFGDDTAKISLYQDQLTARLGQTSYRRARRSYCSGCLASTFWTAIQIPISILIGLGIYDAVLRLFAGKDSAASLLASAGDLAPMLAPYLPLPESIAGILLAERSWQLTLLLGFLTLLYGLVSRFTMTSRTLQVGPSGWSWLAFGAVLPFVYFFLNGALLIISCIVLVIVLLVRLLYRLLLRGTYLRVRALVIRRVPSRSAA